ncbi:MAG: hypothetical protein AB8B69_11595, partial [Chitinophagales bacterium]
IKIPKGWTVVAYQDSNFRGKSITFTQSVANLQSRKFNDVISSVKITRPKRNPPVSSRFDKLKSPAPSGQVALPLPSPVRPPPPPIKKINYLGQYPSDSDNNWSDNLQGVTHDESNWYFTQMTKLWKFPFSHDLNKKLNGPNAAQQIYQVKIPSNLAKQGYNHFCDLDYYKGYLFVPIEGYKYVYVESQKKPSPFFKPLPPQRKKQNLTPLMLVYKASNLQYIGSYKMTKQTNAGWCAIHHQSQILYTSSSSISHSSNARKIHRYRIDFNSLKQGKVVLTFKDYYNLYNESGSKTQDIKKYMQGGDFSEDGKYLFLVNGRDSNDTKAKDGGVWVFHNDTGRKFTKSFSENSDFNSANNTKTSVNSTFKYEYHPGWSKYEEPEGITVGNLGAYKIKGEIHVIMLDNDASNDELYFKHYEVVR